MKSLLEGLSHTSIAIDNSLIILVKIRVSKYQWLGEGAFTKFIVEQSDLINSSQINSVLFYV